MPSTCLSNILFPVELFRKSKWRLCCLSTLLTIPRKMESPNEHADRVIIQPTCVEGDDTGSEGETMFPALLMSGQCHSHIPGGHISLSAACMAQSQLHSGTASPCPAQPGLGSQVPVHLAVSSLPSLTPSTTEAATGAGRRRKQENTARQQKKFTQAPYKCSKEKKSWFIISITEKGQSSSCYQQMRNGLQLFSVPCVGGDFLSHSQESARGGRPESKTGLLWQGRGTANKEVSPPSQQASLLCRP